MFVPKHDGLYWLPVYTLGPSGRNRGNLNANKSTCVSSSSAVIVRAPGKLFLLGEYAVLFGGPAIVQAVDRYVEVTVEACSGRAGFEVHSLGARLDPFTGEMGDALEFGEQESGHGLVRTVFEALFTHGVLTEQLGRIKCTVDSRELFENHNKIGLGSSAAITHALIRAIVDYSSERGQRVSLPKDFAFAVHRNFQHGRGSGADIGAGVMGGTFCYRLQPEPALPAMTPVVIPPELHTLPVWAGKPASTSEALSTLAGFKEAKPGPFSNALSPLMSLAERGVEALGRGDSEGFIRCCEDYSHNLSEFGRTVGVDIMSAAHRELRKLATESGVVYKPSGAGNGDIGVAYSLDINALDSFAHEARKAGYERLALGIGRACYRI